MSKEYNRKARKTNPETGETEVVVLTYQGNGNPLFVRDGKYSLYWHKQVRKLSKLGLSRTAHNIFLWFMGDLVRGNEIFIKTEDLAAEFDLDSRSIWRAIKELRDNNVILPTRQFGRSQFYGMNPRLLWNGTIAERPVDLTPYPLIGGKE